MTPNAEISAKLVMTLRDKTGLPMMKCKKALEETRGQYPNDDAWLAAATEHLRKSGQATMDKLAGREATEGGLGLALGNGIGALVLLGCQTDFVARNESFKALVKSLAETAIAAGAKTVDELLKASLEGTSVGELLVAKTAQIGERLVIAKVALVHGSVVTGYNHDGRVAALVAGAGEAQKLRTVALHVASANPAPLALDRGSLDPAVVRKEEEIILATPDVQAKPEAMRPKIVQGKLGRFFKEQVLLEQELVVGGEKGETVEKFAKRNSLTVTAFARLAV